MSFNNKAGSADQFMEDLLDAIFQAIERDEHAMNELYEESAINRDEVVSNILKRVNTLKFETRKAHARARMQSLIEAISEFQHATIRGVKPALIAKLKEAIGLEADSPAFAFFHKLESLEEEDIRNILAELDVARLLDQQTRKPEKPL